MEKRIVLLAAALTLACGGGGGGGKPSCGASDPCGAGFYCAHTPDGNVCWPDTAAPVISLASLTCSTSPCRRDSVLTVSATVTDENAMGTVTAVIDGDTARPRTLAHVSGDQYALDLGPGDVPFPHFEHAVAATVNATDEAGNHAAEAPVAPVLVTRMKWTRQLTGVGDTVFPLFSPAVLGDGTIVVAGSDGSVHFVGKANGAESRSAVSIGSVISSPPAVGSDAIWVATQDGRLHELQLDGTIVSLPANCSTTQQLVGPPAVSGQHAFVGSKSAVLLAANASGYCNRLALPNGASSPPVVTSSSHVFVATDAILRSYSLNGQEDIVEDWTGITPAPVAPALAGPVSSALAIDSGGGAWTVAQSGAVDRTTSSASTSAVLSVSAGSVGGIVLGDNSAVLSDAAKRLVRARASGSVPWTTSDPFTGVPAAGLALGGSVPIILVPTDQGRVYVVNQSDGHIQWSAELSGQSLEPANIWTDPGSSTSTAYLAGADGNLYAIIVDGALDTSAPWPKAFHDPRNTSNAGVTP